MRTFGIEIKEPGLTEEDKVLLCKIQESKRLAELKKGKIRKSTDFEVDEEFSRLCSIRTSKKSQLYFAIAYNLKIYFSHCNRKRIYVCWLHTTIYGR